MWNLFPENCMLSFSMLSSLTRKIIVQPWQHRLTWKISKAWQTCRWSALYNRGFCCNRFCGSGSKCRSLVWPPTGTEAEKCLTCQSEENGDKSLDNDVTDNQENKNETAPAWKGLNWTSSHFSLYLLSLTRSGTGPKFRSTEAAVAVGGAVQDKFH